MQLLLSTVVIVHDGLHGAVPKLQNFLSSHLNLQLQWMKPTMQHNIYRYSAQSSLYSAVMVMEWTDQ